MLTIDPSQISGLGPYTQTSKKDPNNQPYTLFYPKTTAENPKAFLVVRNTTLELRTDRKLANLLTEKYETVMQSRYFGKNGLEIVPSGQLTADELADLIRLSYNLTTKAENQI